MAKQDLVTMQQIANISSNVSNIFKIFDMFEYSKGMILVIFMVLLLGVGWSFRQYFRHFLGSIYICWLVWLWLFSTKSNPLSIFISPVLVNTCCFKTSVNVHYHGHCTAPHFCLCKAKKNISLDVCVLIGGIEKISCN